MIDSRLLPCAHCKCDKTVLEVRKYDDIDGSSWNRYVARCVECFVEVAASTEQQVIGKWNTRAGVLQTTAKRMTFRYHGSKSWHCFSNDEIEIAFATMKDAFTGLTEYLESSNKLGKIKVIATPEDGISPVEFLAYAANCQLYNSNCCLSFDISIA